MKGQILNCCHVAKLSRKVARFNQTPARPEL
jgi:hypothetical protein